MARSYHNKDGKLIFKNGQTEVRLEFMHHLKLDSHPGRVIKVFFVADILKNNPGNPANYADMIALSFREQDVNRKEYHWHPDEESFVHLKAVTAEEIVAEKNESDGMF